MKEIKESININSKNENNNSTLKNDQQNSVYESEIKVELHDYQNIEKNVSEKPENNSANDNLTNKVDNNNKTSVIQNIIGEPNTKMDLNEIIKMNKLISQESSKSKEIINDVSNVNGIKKDVEKSCLNLNKRKVGRPSTKNDTEFKKEATDFNSLKFDAFAKKSEHFMKKYVDDEIYNSFVKDYFRRKILEKNKKPIILSVIEDLNIMLKEKRIFIQTATSLIFGTNKPILCFNLKNLQGISKANLSRGLDTDQNEEKQYVWFREINLNILKKYEFDNMKDYEQLKDLIEEMEQLCSSKQDKFSAQYLVEGGFVSSTSVDKVLDLYKNKKNPFIIDWVDSRMEYEQSNNKMTIYNEIILNFEVMIQNREQKIPSYFGIMFETRNSTQFLHFQKKLEGKHQIRTISTNLDEFDIFEMFRVWEEINKFLLSKLSKIQNDEQNAKIQSCITTLTNLITQKELDSRLISQQNKNEKETEEDMKEEIIDNSRLKFEDQNIDKPSNGNIDLFLDKVKSETQLVEKDFIQQEKNQ